MRLFIGLNTSGRLSLLIEVDEAGGILKNLVAKVLFVCIIKAMNESYTIRAPREVLLGLGLLLRLLAQ